MKFAKIKYLLLRRICQVSILVLFILGNYSIATLKNVQYKQEVGIFGGNIESLMGNSSSVLAKEPSIFSHIVQGNLSHSSWFG